MKSVSNIPLYTHSYLVASPKDYTKHYYAGNFRGFEGSEETDIYYYHSDHLGSASWITDASGIPIQYLQYTPFGEPFVDQRMTNYSERFTFIGKERDEETGYYYFDARYLWSTIGFLSVDPLSDKYPSLSGYAYCAWNPLRFVDPTGMELEITDNDRSRNDILSIVAEKFKNRISFNGTKVSVDTEGLSQDDINSDAGFSLLNNMVNKSENKYLYETGEIEGLLGIENLSVTPRLEHYQSGDLLKEGYQGQVKINSENIWLDPKGESINRGSIVFHELQENFERTDNKLPYVYTQTIKGPYNFYTVENPNKRGAHQISIDKANAGLTRSARSAYSEGKVHHTTRQR